MKKGTRLNLRCKKCGRAFKDAGNLNRHTTHHRASDAAYRKWQREERGWDQDHRE